VLPKGRSSAAQTALATTVDEAKHSGVVQRRSTRSLKGRERRHEIAGRKKASKEATNGCFRPASGNRKLLRLQQSCDGLDLVAGVFRQASADRTAEIERRMPHENLRGQQVAQHRHILEAALLVEHARLDRQRQECRADGLAGVTRMGL